jgi:predicted P-loop ATPase
VSQHLLDQLHALPDDWGLVAVAHNKRPYQLEWQKNPLTKAQVADEITAGRAKAVGVIAGPASGGLLFVDHDGISASEVLESIGAPLRDLPKSWAMTSGRDGRFQIIYRVPEQFWDQIHTRKIKSGKTDAEGNAEQLELRWAGCQSVVIGAHPSTAGYRWLKGRSPQEQDIAEAPLVLIEQMLRQPDPEPAPMLPPPPPPSTASDSERAIAYLQALDTARADDYDTWLQVGMALHSVGDDSLLSHWEHWSRQSAKHKPKDCEQKWRSFNASTGGITLGTLGQLAKQDGWRPPERRKPPVAPTATPTKPLLPSPETAQTPPDRAYAPTFSKPTKLEAAELLAMLRAQAEGGRIRYNSFSQQIELDGRNLEGAERFYLSIAEQGYKVSKELAIDCLIQVAHENPYDPVRMYLEHVEATVTPVYIGGLATAYLRPEDAALGQPTLYDHMLRCTLIGAVRRAFEPGSKHDTACVLMGDQGARKSSFWSALGGGFFSDALGDISSKDDLMVLHRSWIMEWAELDTITGRKHAGQVKAFLSQSTDLFRVPYGKATEAFPRRGIIVGSTNRSTGFLVDDTGNRRFWVIPTTRTEAEPIDTPTLMAERDAIWSAAVAAYRAGERNFLPTELAQQVTQENEGYQVENPWKAPIEAWLASPGNSYKPITSEMLLTEAVCKPIERQSRADQMQVGTIMRELGYEKRRQSVDGAPKWVFFQP